ncbi:hypothetical protein K4H28_09990 [Deefgea tanakiae]|uniref:Energy transducer TonB n=1 Tax=Deefgea tanakiae TaxID=2865840 RepID=A0ABX8Z267_9NEIS|nr:hypothetical protein [Deefgea tanakiae]QZA76661.1 hypothetical protein K4H28_09990 [Deefgea tanakiae]
MLPFQLLDMPTQSTTPPHWLKLVLLSLLLHAAVLIVWQPAKPTHPTAASALAIQLLMRPPLLAKQLTTNKTQPEKISPQAKPQPSNPQLITKTQTQIQHQAQYGQPLSASAVAATAPASPALNLDVSSALANPATAPRQQLVQRHGEKPRQLNTEAPEHETALSQDLKKAIRKDCRKAYSSMGLLAIPLLMKDSVTDDGCDW